MEPYLRWYADRLEGLGVQITELIGLARKVPPLIQADRERRWADTGARPSDGSEDLVDVYGREAGAEEGWGFAPFDRAIYSAALVLGWETFVAFLADEIVDIRSISRHRINNFERLEKSYEDWLGINLRTTWPVLDEIRLARNAIVHNVGMYTAKYLESPLARLPERDVQQGLTRVQLEEHLVDREQIPLNQDYVVIQLKMMLDVATVIRHEAIR